MSKKALRKVLKEDMMVLGKKRAQFLTQDTSQERSSCSSFMATGQKVRPPHPVSLNPKHMFRISLILSVITPAPLQLFISPFILGIDPFLKNK